MGAAVEEEGKAVASVVVVLVYSVVPAGAAVNCCSIVEVVKQGVEAVHDEADEEVRDRRMLVVGVRSPVTVNVVSCPLLMAFTIVSTTTAGDVSDKDGITDTDKLNVCVV